ncbi:helix-turn-helix transcriptional regulator [Vibrio sp. CyArs1]|uniref:helix-turn-helix transcriptional regulator n=1 Tax=Vibrio sp. CyArs1 TaxID=2682577 RepID=UPI001F061FFE|nr:helix-turn-helix transcriptional regulator [Vibrio sp. CyArs1]
MSHHLNREFILSQVDMLNNAPIDSFDSAFVQAIKNALIHFGMDRMTIWPNSRILVNSGEILSVSLDDRFTINPDKFLNGKQSFSYLRLVNLESISILSEADLRTSNMHVLSELANQGVKLHIMVKLELYGERFGGMSFSSFRNLSFSESSKNELISVCRLWLLHWQYSSTIRPIRSVSRRVSDAEKVLKLTKKQLPVLALLASGLTTKECGEILFLSSRTIESHKYKMMNDLDFETYTELLQFAYRNGIVNRKNTI